MRWFNYWYNQALVTRDTRTRTDWSWTKRFGAVLGPDRAKAKQNGKFRTGPGPIIIGNLRLDQDQQDLDQLAVRRSLGKTLDLPSRLGK